MSDEKKTPQDDPRTRRRRLAETVYERAREKTQTAAVALGETPPNITTALEDLREAFVALRAMQLHALELRSVFQRKATLAMGDALHRDMAALWQKALMVVHVLDGQVNEGGA
jgi:hypothetical protein